MGGLPAHAADIKAFLPSRAVLAWHTQGNWCKLTGLINILPSKPAPTLATDGLLIHGEISGSLKPINCCPRGGILIISFCIAALARFDNVVIATDDIIHSVLASNPSIPNSPNSYPLPTLGMSGWLPCSGWCVRALHPNPTTIALFARR